MNDYSKDLIRYKNKPSLYVKILLLLFRKSQAKKCSFLYRCLYRIWSSKYGIEIPSSTRIGAGLYLGHVNNIIINPNAVIGMNCNLHGGCVIGQQNRGALKGSPIIGNRVWIGINAVVVGSIHIGDDVLIAPNSFVNCNVPSHSVVFGNPCIIKHRDFATQGYINNICKE